MRLVEEERTRNNSGVCNGFLLAHCEHSARSSSVFVVCLRAVPTEMPCFSALKAGAAQSYVFNGSGWFFEEADGMSLLVASGALEFTARPVMVEVALAAFW